MQLTECPPWCDGRHEMMEGGYATHTSAGICIEDAAAAVRGNGFPIYLEQRVAADGPDVHELRSVVCGAARLTPATARIAARALLRAAMLLEVTR
ncbi:hypothetical protein [Pimelobacter simplex]|uniref:hypothetical protein n=1 Tax=Nocardioides simplex TaxID=2045 RepID=UPI003AB0794F